jgi:hypothetical protein
VSHKCEHTEHNSLLTVHTGGGQTLGSTFTLPSPYGSFVIAFLALFVTWSGTCLWDIICFGFHQHRSTSDEQGGFHHQQQVLLRSGLSDAAILWRLLVISWHWRSKTAAILKKNSLLILVAITHLTLIFAAGIFSSRLAQASNEVLVRSTFCGFMDDKFASDTSRLQRLSIEDLEDLDALALDSRSIYTQSLTYSRSCYTNLTDGDVSASCGATFPVPKISSSIDKQAKCPFPGNVCTGPALAIDSGLIDSHLHLGINAPPQDRIQMRRRTTCAPVPMEEKFTAGWTNQTTITLPPVAITSNLGFITQLPGDLYKYYDVGQRVYSAGNLTFNFTFAVSNYSLFIRPAHSVL